MNPWVLLVAGIAWVVSLALVGSWQRDDGETAERSKWQAKESAALKQANATIDKQNADARAKEKQNADALAKIGEKHAKDNETNAAQAKRDVAAARDGALRLRVPGACPASRNGPAAQPVTPAGGRDDSTTGELPREVVANLLQLANDADAIVGQLTACQAVILEDRRENIR